MEETPLQPVRKGRPLLFILIGTQVITLFIVVYLAYQISELKKQPAPPASISQNISPTGTDYSAPTIPSDWVLYSNSEYGYSFSHPPRFKVLKPSFEATPPGEVTFIAGSKSDKLVVDVITFSGSTNDLVQKYTEYESTSGQTYTSLNYRTLLGERISGPFPYESQVYRYHFTYDQSVNPGAEDVFTYTGFLVSGGKGFVLRISSPVDEVSEFSQILDTISTVR